MQIHTCYGQAKWKVFGVAARTNSISEGLKLSWHQVQSRNSGTKGEILLMTNFHWEQMYDIIPI